MLQTSVLNVTIETDEWTITSLACICRFTQFPADLAIPENIDIGYELAEVQAVDSDYEPENRLITYSIQSGSLGKVSIDTNTVSTVNTCIFT